MIDQSKDSFKDNLDVAVVGLACRFPGADNIEMFWHNLCQGVESISKFTDEELVSFGVDPLAMQSPNFVKAGSILENADLFDAAFFSYSPREAELIDPQHRIFLECAWEALENAGYNPETYPGLIGVYAGTSLSTYLLYNLINSSALKESDDSFQIMIGNDKDFLSTRVSYELNLRGPSVDVQTGCSTSLVALHLACQSLLSFQSDMVLAGGVSAQVPQRTGYFYQVGGICSPDGHCRAFDAKARGTVFGSGVGVVVLKRLADAIADRDSVYAVIKGSAINNDGSSKVGFTAPSIEGQAQVISMAQMIAGIDPETITYVEAHGTGTSLGDPIEVAALTKAFSTLTRKKQFCAIGSVKTNIGHLDAAAGIAGFIKTALALKHELQPPSLFFDQPNPKIDFENSPFYVNTELSEWKRGVTPRRAGVSSFGIGGTNAHVILEEALLIEPSSESIGEQLLLLSAKTSPALEKMTSNLVEFLKRSPELNLADVAYTLQAGRQLFSYRRMALSSSFKDTIETLERCEPTKVLTHYQEQYDRPVVFMFPGGGAQYINMGLDLYRTEPTFRLHLDSCCQLLRPLLGDDLRARIYPSQTPDEAAHRQFNRASIALPALFVIEYSLAQLWMSWGIRPQALIGHSLGEYVAACLAGILSLEDALSVVVLRGRLFEQLPAGAMLSVGLGEAELDGLVNGQLSVAAINGPSQCVLSGSEEAIAAAAAELDRRSVEWRRLHIDVAAHSPLVEEILDEFEAGFRGLELKQPEIGILSNLSGDWVRGGEASNAWYWRRHLREPVRFGQGIKRLLEEPGRVLLEVGPGQSLSSLAKLQTEGERRQEVVSSMRRPSQPDADDQYLLQSLGKLWLSGVKVDWGEFHRGEQRARLPLPTYPFERQRYWIKPSMAGGSVERARGGKKAELAEWFYLPSWKRTLRPKQFRDGELKVGRRWLVFVDENGLGEAVARRLREEGQEVAEVREGGEFRKEEEWSYRINPRVAEGYQKLIQGVAESGEAPAEILHFWSVDGYRARGVGREVFDNAQITGFYSLLFLAQAIEEQRVANAINLWVVTNGLQNVEGEAPACPEKATILGICKVIPQENEKIACRCIDVVLHKHGGQFKTSLVETVLSEVGAKSGDVEIAYRGNNRWVRTYEPVRVEADNHASVSFREHGVYLLTGGMGNVGLLIAEYLARTVRARLALIGRSCIPDKGEWDQWLGGHGVTEEWGRKIKKIMSFEELGAEILLLNADVADPNQMRSVITKTYERFGELHGVIHAAGVAGEKALALIPGVTTAICEQNFRARVHGLYVLKEALEGRNIDFCLLISSNASILGGLGNVAYSAANLFMDAFASNYSESSGANWISVNCDGWPSEKGETLSRSFQTSLDQYAMTPEESVEAIRRVVSTATFGNIVISTGDLPSRLKLWIERGASQVGGDSKKSDAVTLQPRPALKTAYIAPNSEVEQVIASIWQELLGIGSLGVHDNFFDLGGNSLLGLKVISRLNKILNVDLPVVALFEGPTVSALSKIACQSGNTEFSFEEVQKRGEGRRKRRQRKNGGNAPT